MYPTKWLSKASTVACELRMRIISGQIEIGSILSENNLAADYGVSRSATVAALTTSGLVIPLLSQADVNLALVVLATGAGSLIASHVNDAGFWMFKEFFG
jgi:hypothetical protein